MLLLNCALCGEKNQLSLKKENSKILMVSLKWIKLLINFLLTGNKFMPELHLKQPGFTYRACGLFTKYCARIQRFRKTGNLKHLFKNELDKNCFPHDAAYSDNKDLTKRTISDKILKDRAHEIVRNLECHGNQRALASMVYKIFDKKTRSGVSVN